MRGSRTLSFLLSNALLDRSLMKTGVSIKLGSLRLVILLQGYRTNRRARID
jgi:hypothetical protein